MAPDSITPHCSLSTEELEEKVTSTVQTIVEVALELGSSLSSIEKNTRTLFWWTSWAITITLGLFILHLLVKVSAQLATLNTYQAVFQRMWDEDRVKEEKDRETRREAMRRATAPRRPTAQRLQSPSDSEFESLDGEYMGSVVNELNDVVQRVGPLPEAGTAEYDEMMRRLAEEMRRPRM
ncbi:hypothetical protein F5Y09DRAFT_342433 [Xylaria sp. FL1042]|nr:hypothetical protein F5Y09DRAFT_342433 [Xylaria sp. FL1042]